MASSKMVPLAARQMLPRLPGKVTPPGTQPHNPTTLLENNTLGTLEHNRSRTHLPRPRPPQPHNPTTPQPPWKQNLPAAEPPPGTQAPGTRHPWNTTTQPPGPLDHWTPGTHNLYGPTHWCACRIQCVNVSALLALWGCLSLFVC